MPILDLFSVKVKLKWAIELNGYRFPITNGTFYLHLISCLFTFSNINVFELEQIGRFGKIVFMISENFEIKQTSKVTKS